MAACILCGKEAPLKMRMPVDQKKFTPTKFGSIHHCGDCDLGFVYPRPTVEETNEFYQLDAYYTQGKSHFVEVRETFWDKVLLHLSWRTDYSRDLTEVVVSEVKKGGTILDVGCSSGQLVAKLSDRGYRCIGVERDANTISVRAGSVLEGTAENLPAMAESFDAIVYSHVVEHLVDPVKALRAAAKLLKPSGVMVIEVPNNASLIAKYMGLAWENLDPPRHLSFFTERSLRELLQRAGLQGRSTYYSGFCRHFSASYIATEQKIYDHLSGARPATRNSHLSSWALLVNTALSSKKRKYDAVGIIASSAAIRRGVRES